MQNITLLIILIFSLQLKASMIDINRLNQELDYLNEMAQTPLFYFGENNSKDEVKLTQSGLQKQVSSPESLLEELDKESLFRQLPPNAEEVEIKRKKKAKNTLRRGR